MSEKVVNQVPVVQDVGKRTAAAIFELAMRAGLSVDEAKAEVRTRFQETLEKAVSELPRIEEGSEKKSD